MYDALGTLYESVDVSRKMLLRNKLPSTCTTKSNIVASCLMKLADLRDQLGVVGDKVKDDELVWIALNGFISSWHHFVQVICGREKLLVFNRLWDALIG